ncbi:response regulator [Pelosinus sp. sgz500959]|uniref:response regulator n=1 Tax=Pelosinus sp. sgz500959 TaxID=3242472 RepID=UPI0036706BB6
MDSIIKQKKKNKKLFLKVFAMIFLPLVSIVTLIVGGFYKDEKRTIINILQNDEILKVMVEPFVILWIILCFGVVSVSYVLARSFMKRVQNEQELEQYRKHLQELVEERTAELEVANRLLRSSEERAHLVKKIASAANADDNPDEVLSIAIRSIAENMQWPIGHVHVISLENPEEMVSASMWYLQDQNAYQPFIKHTEEMRFGLEVGLPGRVLKAKKAILIENIAESSNFPRAKVAISLGINAGFAFPVIVKGEVVAVLEFFAQHMGQLGDDVLTFAEQIGEQLALLIERKQGEEALRTEQEKAQRYLNIAGSIIVVINEDENINLLNKAGYRLLGYCEEELIGENWFTSVVSKEDAENKKTEFRQMMNQEIELVEFYETLIRLKDGTEKLIAWHNVLIYDKKGKPIGLLASGEDITEHRKVDKELRKLSQAVEQSPVSVVITDRKGKIEYVNARFCEKTHYQPEEVIGKNPRILKSGTLPRSFYQELWETILSGNIWRGDFLNKTKEGSRYWERASISSIMDAAGHITHFIAIKEDITEQKKMEEELLQAKVEAELSNKAKGDFLANMSHEIRTPMNAVIGLTHLALQTDLMPKQQDYLHKISVSAQSLMGIINDILDFSKFSAGKLDMENIQFNLWEVLEDIITILNSKAEEKGLEMVLNVAKNVPMRLMGDPHRLKQILLNLVSNALKFTNQGEVVIFVKVITEGSNRVQLEFIVRDTGIGMKEEEKKRLFNAFTQADGSTTRKYGGTGLGLVISKQLVEMMGGAIHVKSSPGQGSEFIFTAHFGSYGEEEAKCFSQSDLHDLKVLVIDDNESSCLAFKEMLERLTFRVSLATSGEEGIRRLIEEQEEPFDLILMDWLMPDMNGIETARYIREQMQMTTIPIILVTSYSGDDVRQQAKELNLEGFLVKPITPSVLFNAAMELFGKINRQPLCSLPRMFSDPEGWNSLQGVKILLVEDNEINLQVAREIMEDRNIIVTVARNGREAVKLVREIEFDGVLMDIQMPEMDGLEATKIIRRDHPVHELPIIAMTADVVVDRIKAYLAAGMNDSIFKPIAIEQMFNTLHKWVKPQSVRLKPMQNKEFLGTKEESPIVIPQLAGINVEAGLARVSSNTKLYRKLLVQFLENHEKTVDVLQKTLQEGDHAVLKMSLHTLKGVAGTIGADDLYHEVQKMENYTNDGMHEKMALQMENLYKNLLQVLDSIRWFKDSAPDVIPSVLKEREFDHPTISEEDKILLESLQGYLTNYDMEATVVFEKLKILPIASIYQTEFKKIQTLMNHYDFEGALNQLNEVAKLIE